MKIQSTFVKSKVMPVLAATVLSSGAMFAQCNCQRKMPNQNNTVHFNDVTRQTNRSLDSLSLLHKDNVINFTDYYEKSPQIIEDAKLDDDVLKKECEVSTKDKGVRKGLNNLTKAFLGLTFLTSFALAIVGIGLMDGHDIDYSEKRHKGYKIIGAIAGVAAILAVALTTLKSGDKIQKDIDNCVEKNQERLSIYKEEKLKSLETSTDKTYQISHENLNDL